MILRSTVKWVEIGALVVFLTTPGLDVAAQPYESAHIAWRPDGAMLAIGYQTTLRILDGITYQTLNMLSNLEHQVTAPSWSPDGSKLAVVNGSEVQIWQSPWDENNLVLVATLPISNPIDRITSVAWSPDGSKIAIAFHLLDIWDVSTPSPGLMYSKESHELWITQVAWDPSSTFLATAGVDRKVKIWDAATGNVVSTMVVITSLVTYPPSEALAAALCVSWGPDDTRLVIGAEDGTVRIWDRTSLSGAVVTTEYGQRWVLFGHEGAVESVDWSPDGTRIASGSLDGTVRLWDASTGEVLQVFQIGGDASITVAWSPDGTRLAYSSEGGHLEIIDVSPSNCTSTSAVGDVSGPMSP